MRRRTFVVGLGALTGGCLESSDSNAGESPDPTATATPTDTGSPSGRSESGEYEVRDLTVSTTVDGPDARYVLEPSSFYSVDAVERERTESGEEQVVTDVSDLESAAVRSAVETAIRDRSWRSDELPDGLEATLDRVDFFTGATDDDTYTHVGLTLYRFDPDAPPAIEFDASVVDRQIAPGSPGALEFSLRNRSSDGQEVFSGTVPPFGMLRATAVDGEGNFLLWRDYEEEGCFSRHDGGWARCDIGRITEVPAGDAVTRRYQILPSDTEHYPDDTVPPAAGRYSVSDSLSFNREGGAPSTTLAFTVEFTLETS